jgi:mono/diheme cytochrome c family protein
MSTTTERRLAALALAGLLGLGAAARAQPATDTYGFGQPATGEDLARFFSSMPDGSGLPPGSGSAERGKAVYDANCMACHGANLEGGVGDRLIGGRGTLPGDDPAKAPVKTVESYWPYATTLFDYIRRAMPFQESKSLSDDEVYAVSAYILNLNGIIGKDDALDAQSLPKVAMPNRDGFIPFPRNPK